MKRTQFLTTLAAALMVSALVIGCSQNGPVAAPGDDVSAIAAQKPLSGEDQSIPSSRGTFLRGSLRSTPADPLASGNAKWERRADRVKFSAEVEDVRTSGAHQVRVNGKSVGSVRVVNGIGDLNLDTRNGHQVPPMKSGDLVEVFNPTGVLILSGNVR